MRVTKRLDLPLLEKELAAASVTVAGLGLSGEDPADPGAQDLHTYDGTGTALEMPAGSQAVVDAHVAPPLVVEHAETRSVAAVLRTTDGAFHEVYRLPTAVNTIYRATFSMAAIDAASFDAKDSEARLIFKRVSTAPAQVGATVVLSNAQDAAASAWAIQAQVQGNDLVIGVRGAAGRTIDWILAGDVVVFAPGGLAA